MAVTAPLLSERHWKSGARAAPHPPPCCLGKGLSGSWDPSAGSPEGRGGAGELGVSFQLWGKTDGNWDARGRTEGRSCGIGTAGALQPSGGFPQPRTHPPPCLPSLRTPPQRRSEPPARSRCPWAAPKRFRRLRGGERQRRGASTGRDGTENGNGDGNRDRDRNPPRPPYLRPAARRRGPARPGDAGADRAGRGRRGAGGEDRRGKDRNRAGCRRRATGRAGGGRRGGGRAAGNAEERGGRAPGKKFWMGQSPISSR